MNLTALRHAAAYTTVALTTKTSGGGRLAPSTSKETRLSENPSLGGTRDLGSGRTASRGSNGKAGLERLPGAGLDAHDRRDSFRSNCLRSAVAGQPSAHGPSNDQESS
jgi:hypothetical protein